MVSLFPGLCRCDSASPVEEARLEGEFTAVTIFRMDLCFVKERRAQKMPLPASEMSTFAASRVCGGEGELQPGST